MDFNDYVTMERDASDRLDDLRHVPLLKPDTPRRIDRVIDYFGDSRLSSLFFRTLTA